MTEELKELSPLALPASRKPARPRPRPKKANTMQDVKIEPPTSDEWLGDLRHDIHTLSDQVQTLHTQLLTSNMLADLRGDTVRVAPIQRRRTEDEMRRALALLASGQRRPQDDESTLVLEDAIGEVFALRQAYADLMQATTTAYQNGLAAVRRMTEK